MSNLFLSFYLMVNIIDFSLGLNWLSAVISLLFLPQIYWTTSSQILKTVQNIITYLYSELSAVFGAVALPGIVFIFLRFFLFIFFKIFLLSCILDESIDSNLTVKTIGHQWYWRDEYRNFLITDIRGIFITFLFFTFTRLILFRSGIKWEPVRIPELNRGPTPGFFIPKLNPLKVKNHTPVKGKTKSNLPKKSG